MSEQVATEVTATDEMPETMVINGVTYRREGDWVDKRVNHIKQLWTICERSGLSFRDVYFICHSQILPD